MLLASIAFFFFTIFLVVAITSAIAYLGFLKKREELEEIDKGDWGSPSGVPLDSGEIGFASSEVSVLLRSNRLSTISFWDSILNTFNIGEWLRERLEQAETNWSVGRLTAMMLLWGICILALMLRFFPAWLALLGGAAAASTPVLYILGRRNRRFAKFREHFPDMLDSLARALRAGYPLSAALEMISGETQQPVSGELRRTSTEANLGRGWPHALANLGQRVPLLEVNTFIAAVQLHSRTGGRLSDVMSDLAEQMRESNALQGEVRAMAAHGKLTGLILTILPLGIALMMTIVSPSYMRELTTNPLGRTLVGVAILCLIAAHFVIRRIVDIRV